MANKILTIIVVLLVVAPLNAESIRRNLAEEAETIESIRAQIAIKIKEQDDLISARKISTDSVTLKANQLKSLESQLLQKKIAAETAYKNYYNEKIRCDGFSDESSTVQGNGEIVFSQTCLNAPLGPEALDLAMQKFQFSSFEVDAWTAEQIYNQQNQYVSSQNRAAVINPYLQLARYYDQMRFESRGALTGCLYQYGSETNTDPIECKKQKEDAYYYSNAFAQYNTKRVILERYYIGENINTETAKQNSDTSKATLTTMESAVKAREDQIKALLDLCLKNAQVLKGQATDRIKEYNDVNKSIEDKKNEIKSLISSDNDKILQVSKDLDVLAAKLLQLEKAKN